MKGDIHLERAGKATSNSSNIVLDIALYIQGQVIGDQSDLQHMPVFVCVFDDLARTPMRKHRNKCDEA